MNEEIRVELARYRERAEDFRRNKIVVEEYCRIVDLWLSHDDRKKGACRKIVCASMNGDPLYEKMRDKITNAGALALFDYFVNLGVSAERVSACLGSGEDADGSGLQDVIAPVDAAAMMSKVMGRVSSLDTATTDLRQELEQTRRERDELKPFRTAYEQMVGGLHQEAGSEFGAELDRLLNDE